MTSIEDDILDSYKKLKNIYLIDLDILLRAAVEIKRLKKEVDALREFGNKDCTSMADEYLNRGEAT